MKNVFFFLCFFSTIILSVNGDEQVVQTIQPTYYTGYVRCGGDCRYVDMSDTFDFSYNHVLEIVPSNPPLIYYARDYLQSLQFILMGSGTDKFLRRHATVTLFLIPGKTGGLHDGSLNVYNEGGVKLEIFKELGNNSLPIYYSRGVGVYVLNPCHHLEEQ